MYFPRDAALAIPLQYPQSETVTNNRLLEITAGRGKLTYITEVAHAQVNEIVPTKSSSGYPSCFT